jgi:hypothetical protein
MNDDLMKNLCEDEIRGLWSDFIELLVKSYRAAQAIGGDPSEATALQGLIIDCLCERDELDSFLSRNVSAGTRSSLNHECLDNHETILNSSESLKRSDSSLAERLDDEGCFPQLPASILPLLEVHLRTFGNSDWGWKQLQKHFFPAIEVKDLRARYAQVTAERTPNDVLFNKPERWSTEEDYIIVDNFGKNGVSIQTVHDIFVSLGEKRSFDEIRERLLLILTEMDSARTNDALKTHSVSEPLQTSTENEPSSEEWEIDDSLLPTGFS